MRRIILVAVVGALFLLLAAGVASAQPTINCPGGVCNGTNASENFNESPFFDFINTGRGNDVVFANPFFFDRDVVNGAKGRKFINTMDGDPFDIVNCGGTNHGKGKKRNGPDTAIIDPGDTIVGNSCRNVFF